MCHDKIRSCQVTQAWYQALYTGHYSTNARSFFGNDSLNPPFFSVPRRRTGRAPRRGVYLSWPAIDLPLPLTRLLMGKPIR